MEVKLALLILLGPVAALYDFVTNPAAPPHIFVAQWNDSFPNHQIEPQPFIVHPRAHRRVTVTRPS